MDGSFGLLGPYGPGLLRATLIQSTGPSSDVPTVEARAVNRTPDAAPSETTRPTPRTSQPQTADGAPARTRVLAAAEQARGAFPTGDAPGPAPGPTPLDPASADDRAALSPSDRLRVAALEAEIDTLEAVRDGRREMRLDGASETEALSALRDDKAGAGVDGLDWEAPSSPTETRAPSELSEEERRVVEELKARDREVRAHEQAHAAVGGQYAGMPRYEYQTGPDGRRYAIGGSVSIDVSPIPDDPEATIQKMEQVKRAALAPAEPSSADRQIAALADRQRAAAQADLIALRAEARSGGADGASDASSAIAAEARGGYGRAAEAVGAARDPLFSWAA